MKNKAVGIIGCGNMGSSIAQGLKSRYPLFVFDKDKNKTKDVQGIKIADNLSDLANQADILLLAVKPQDFDSVLTELKDKTEGKLIISIAAGITTSYIEKQLPQARVVRAMPNMPLVIGEGITALVKGVFADDKDLRTAVEMFEAFGTAVTIEKEELINAVTAISGSGPAYLFYFVMAISEAAKELNLDEDTANKLVYHTISGSVNLLNKENFDAISLIGKVASKGGTTEAALKIFDERGMNKIILNAIMAAYKRAGELSR